MTGGVQGFFAGLAAGFVLSGGLAAGVLSGFGGGAQAGVTYSSTVVLENERVRVKDVTFPPGVLDTGMHTHELPHVGVILTEGTLAFTEPGGKPEHVAFEAGGVGYREAHVTHQVANPGASPMRVIEVEIK